METTCNRPKARERRPPRRSDAELDSQGFRPNVGIIIANPRGQLFWARRLGQQSWQFPQGGIQHGENPEEALYRELYEEVGLESGDVEVIACTRRWLRYRIPDRLIRNHRQKFVGQKQKWFLLRMRAEDASVQVDHGPRPEFDHWRWVSYWYPLSRVVDFKREVYRSALDELSSPLWQHIRTEQRSNR
ncbi:MAG: RNA pyrophosphohydrolase [Pseudomonadota bacterium]|nr:RNA pyrophosphohydrolase [Pseudomonadota bacterium]